MLFYLCVLSEIALRMVGDKLTLE